MLAANHIGSYNKGAMEYEHQPLPPQRKKANKKRPYSKKEKSAAARNIVRRSSVFFRPLIFRPPNNESSKDHTSEMEGYTLGFFNSEMFSDGFKPLAVTLYELLEKKPPGLYLPEFASLDGKSESILEGPHLADLSPVNKALLAEGMQILEASEKYPKALPAEIGNTEIGAETSSAENFRKKLRDRIRYVSQALEASEKYLRKEAGDEEIYRLCEASFWIGEVAVTAGPWGSWSKPAKVLKNWPLDLLLKFSDKEARILTDAYGSTGTYRPSGAGRNPGGKNAGTPEPALTAAYETLLWWEATLSSPSRENRSEREVRAHLILQLDTEIYRTVEEPERRRSIFLRWIDENLPSSHRETGGGGKRRRSPTFGEELKSIDKLWSSLNSDIAERVFNEEEREEFDARELEELGIFYAAGKYLGTKFPAKRAPIHKTPDYLRTFFFRGKEYMKERSFKVDTATVVEELHSELTKRLSEIEFPPNREEAATAAGLLSRLFLYILFTERDTQSSLESRAYELLSYIRNWCVLLRTHAPLSNENNDFLASLIHFVKKGWTESRGDVHSLEHLLLVMGEYGEILLPKWRKSGTTYIGSLPVFKALCSSGGAAKEEVREVADTLYRFHVKVRTLAGEEFHILAYERLPKKLDFERLRRFLELMKNKELLPADDQVNVYANNSIAGYIRLSFAAMGLFWYREPPPILLRWAAEREEKDTEGLLIITEIMTEVSLSFFGLFTTPYRPHPPSSKEQQEYEDRTVFIENNLWILDTLVDLLIKLEHEDRKNRDRINGYEYDFLFSVFSSGAFVGVVKLAYYLHIHYDDSTVRKSVATLIKELLHRFRESSGSTAEKLSLSLLASEREIDFCTLISSSAPHILLDLLMSLQKSSLRAPLQRDFSPKQLRSRERLWRIIGECSSYPELHDRMWQIIRKSTILARLQSGKELETRLKPLFTLSPDRHSDPSHSDSAADEEQPVQSDVLTEDEEIPARSDAPTVNYNSLPEHIREGVDFLIQLGRITGNRDRALAKSIRKILSLPQSVEKEFSALSEKTKEGKGGASVERRLEKVKRYIEEPETLREYMSEQFASEYAKQVVFLRSEAAMKIMEELLFRRWKPLTDSELLPSGDPDWENALYLFFSIEYNKKALKKLLSSIAQGQDKWPLDHEINRQYKEYMEKKGVDTREWLRHRRREVYYEGVRYEVYTEENPLKILQMGNFFDTCLGTGGINDYSVVANAAEINKRVLFVRSEQGHIIARKLISIIYGRKLVGFRSYVSKPKMSEFLTCEIDRLALEIAAEAGLSVAKEDESWGGWDAGVGGDGEAVAEAGDGADDNAAAGGNVGGGGDPFSLFCKWYFDGPVEFSDFGEKTRSETMSE